MVRTDEVWREPVRYAEERAGALSDLTLLRSRARGTRPNSFESKAMPPDRPKSC
jgi:hypothetical protein